MYDNPPSGRLESLFMASAALHPNAIAVVDDEHKLTYRELAEKVDRLSNALLHAHDSPRRVGIFAPRGLHAYSAILAVLAAGAAYVPLNPSHPTERTRAVIDQADLDVILVSDDYRATLDELLAPLDSHPLSLSIAAQHAEEIDRSAPPSDLAYLMFTSGSTGTPKGVPITHLNARAFLDSAIAHYELGTTDRCSQTFSLTFDLSVFDLFLAWGSGSAVHHINDFDLLDPASAVAAHGLTLWFSVPSVGALALRRNALTPRAMPSLRWSLFCGEPVTEDVCAAWFSAAPESIVENLYGPTELTIACTRYRWRSDSRRPPGAVAPIGVPFDDLRACIIDDRGNLAQVGELCVAGPQRFGGYWKNAEETESKTIVIDGEPHYRTGDRVSLFDDVLHFLGRADGQIKLNGHRIELGDVEAGLRRINDVVDAVAIPIQNESGTTERLVAAVTVRDRSECTPRQLRRTASEHLPISMLPSQVHIFPALPLNPNGKIDRRALAATVVA